MLPKWHILLGFLFAYILYWVTSINIFEASLIFLSSFLIDFDHYIFYAKRKKILDLKNAYIFLKKIGKKNHKPMMMLFHTIEFIILIGFLSYFFDLFLFILIGMLFHSILDIIDLFNKKMIGCREFSLIRYLVLKRKYPKKYF